MNSSTRTEENKMSDFLNKYLTDKHSDGEGGIEVSDNIECLKDTMALIKSDANCDYECSKSKLEESDTHQELMEAITSLDVTKSIEILCELNELAEKLAVETIEQIMEAM